MLCNKRSHCSEKSVHYTESGICSPHLEKACAHQQRPSTAKKEVNSFQLNVTKIICILKQLVKHYFFYIKSGYTKIKVETREGFNYLCTHQLLLPKSNYYTKKLFLMVIFVNSQNYLKSHIFFWGGGLPLKGTGD